MTVEDFKEIAAKYGIECYYGGSATWYYMVPNSNWYMVNYYLNEHIIIRKNFKYDVRIKRIIPCDDFDKEPYYIPQKDFEEYVKEMLKIIKKRVSITKKKKLKRILYDF